MAAKVRADRIVAGLPAPFEPGRAEPQPRAATCPDLASNTALCLIYLAPVISPPEAPLNSPGKHQPDLFAGTEMAVDRAFTGGHRIDLDPASGDLVVMGGRCQRDWLHCVPK